MYNVIQGDTFETISRKVYGTESNANLLRQSNPNVTEPLSVGTSLTTPKDISSPQNKDIKVDSNNEDEISLLIDDKRFRFFTDITINKGMDKIDSITFSSPMESDNQDFRNTFKPFSFKNIKIYIGESKLFDGTMIDVNPSTTENSKTVEVSAYSRCGVLSDCTASSNQYPIEYNNTKLNQIANELIKPFGIKAIFNDSDGAVFERIALKPSQKILNFLIKLANKRNLVITSDENGNLVFQKAIETGNVVAVLEQGLSPLISVAPNFKPQSYYTHITGLGSVMVGLDGSKYTVKNTLLKDAIRPFVYDEEDTQSSDMKTSVNAKVGRMFGNMVSYNIDVSTWRDKDNNLWTPNTFIKLKSDDSMIYTSYLFLIRKVTFNKSSIKKSAILNIVLHQSFSGLIPKALPWEE